MQGASASVGVELVEIHNDEDSVYSSALDQVRSFEHRVTWIFFSVFPGVLFEHALVVKAGAAYLEDV